MYDDFGLTEEQLAVQTLARKFAQEHIRPIAAKIDDMPVKETKNGKPVLSNGFSLATSFPWDMIREAHKIGFKCICQPEEYGGQDADFRTQVVIMDELAYECAACCKSVTQNWKIPIQITETGTKEQKERFLSRFRDEADYLIATAMTEPSGASDNLIPYGGVDGGVHMSVERKKDGYVLNGTKTFIALGGVASLYIVAGRTDKTVPSYKGSSRFLVPRESPGFSVINQQNKVGFRAYPNGELGFDNVFVPKENLLGKENESIMGGRMMGMGDIELAANAMGICRSAYEKALDYAKTRVHGGKPIIEHQLIGGILVEAYMQLQAARSYIWKVASDDDAGRRQPLRGTLCQRFATEVLRKVLPDLLSVFGGSGVMKELPMEKYIRDSLIFIHLADSPAWKMRAVNTLIGRPAEPAVQPAR